MTPERILRLVDAETLAQSRIEARAVTSAVASMAGVESWYVTADVQSLARRVGSTVRAASQSAAGVTDAHLGRVLSDMIGAPAKTPGVLDLSRPLRHGVNSYEQTYARIAESVRYFESTGLSRLEAIQRTESRVDAMVRTDLALARRGQAHRVYTQTPRVTGWRRIIRPELSITGTCGLCVAASDRPYSRGDLMPLHERCRCTTLPIMGDDDPGRDLDTDALNSLYEQAGSTSAADLKNVRVKAVQDRELGPVLVDARHRIATPDGRERSARTFVPPAERDPRRMLTAELDSIARSLVGLEGRIGDGAPGLDAALTYQRERIALLTARLRAL